MPLNLKNPNSISGAELDPTMQKLVADWAPTLNRWSLKIENRLDQTHAVASQAPTIAKTIATQVVKSTPSTGGAISLTAPAEINVSGSPGNSIGLSWATQPAGYEFAVPNGSVGFDGANAISQFAQSSISVTSPTPSTNPEWALYLAACSGTGTFSAGPAGWTALPDSILANNPIYTKAVPAGGTVTATQTILTPAFVGEAAAILLFSGTAINVVQSGLGFDIGTGAITVTLANPTATGNFILAMLTLGGAPGIVPGIFTDSQGLSQTPLLYIVNQGSTGRNNAIGLQVSLLSACTNASESVTVTYPAVQGGQLVVYEISSLSPIAVKPRFIPEQPADLSSVTGRLGLFNGGTGANLSSTGGASKFLKQASSGAAVTVVQPGYSDLSGNLGTAILTAAAPTVAASQIGIGNGTATSATTGANGATPAQVVGYLLINVAGTTMKIPYYNV